MSAPLSASPKRGWRPAMCDAGAKLGLGMGVKLSISGREAVKKWQGNGVFFFFLGFNGRFKVEKLTNLVNSIVVDELV